MNPTSSQTPNKKHPRNGGVVPSGTSPEQSIRARVRGVFFTPTLPRPWPEGTAATTCCRGGSGRRGGKGAINWSRANDPPTHAARGPKAAAAVGNVHRQFWGWGPCSEIYNRCDPGSLTGRHTSNVQTPQYNTRTTLSTVHCDTHDQINNTHDDDRGLANCRRRCRGLEGISGKGPVVCACREHRAPPV